MKIGVECRMKIDVVMMSDVVMCGCRHDEALRGLAGVPDTTPATGVRGDRQLPGYLVHQPGG